VIAVRNWWADAAAHGRFIRPDSHRLIQRFAVATDQPTLPEDPALLQHLLHEAQVEIKRLQMLIAVLRDRFVRRSERLGEDALQQGVADSVGVASSPSVYSAWGHASFPHKSPASVEETWTVQTDYVSLRVDPGMRTTDTGEYSVGLPDGAYARLSCIDWSSRPYNNCSRDIKLGKNLGDTMKRLGLNAGGGRTREEAAGASRAAGTFGGSFHCVRSDCLHLHIARRLKRLFGENPVAPTSPNSPSQNHPPQIPSRRRG
jgi:hypothetical protein